MSNKCKNIKTLLILFVIWISIWLFALCIIIKETETYINTLLYYHLTYVTALKPNRAGRCHCISIVLTPIYLWRVFNADGRH